MATMKQTRSTDRNEPLLALGVGKRDANGAIPVVVVQESLESYLPPSSVDRQECTIFASNLDKHETLSTKAQVIAYCRAYPKQKRIDGVPSSIFVHSGVSLIYGAGNGLFAGWPIKKDVFFIEFIYKSEEKVTKEFDLHESSIEYRHRKRVMVGDTNKPSHLINHGPTPPRPSAYPHQPPYANSTPVVMTANCVPVEIICDGFPMMWFQATRDINANEEIVWDYGCDAETKFRLPAKATIFSLV